MNKTLFGVLLIGIVAAAQTPPDQSRQIELQKAIWITDAHRDDGKRFIVHADQKLTAFLELESAIRSSSESS
jgi:hypothetical protein